MPSFHLAQLNIARLVAPLKSPLLADFMASLDRINALADDAPGFVWRLQSEGGDATAIRHFGDDFVVNMSVWRGIQSLHDYIYKSGHIEVMRRRKEWFQKLTEAHMVLWWVPAGHLPSLEEAEFKLTHLRKHGPTDEAFTFKISFPAPDLHHTEDLVSIDDTCPVT